MREESRLERKQKVHKKDFTAGGPPYPYGGPPAAQYKCFFFCPPEPTGTHRTPPDPTGTHRHPPTAFMQNFQKSRIFQKSRFFYKCLLFFNNNSPIKSRNHKNSKKIMNPMNLEHLIYISKYKITYKLEYNESL